MAYLDPAAGARRQGTDFAEVAIVNLTAAFGTADNTVADVGAAFSQATLNNNFADVSAKINAILVELRRVGVIT